MNRPRRWLVAPLLLASAAMLAAGAAGAAEIRDKAKLFSPEMVEKAQAELERAEKDFGVPVTIETVETLDGDPIAQVANRHAIAVGAEGVYILIPKKEHSILAESSKHYRQYLTRDRMKSVEGAFTAAFKEGKFDDGLKQGVNRLNSVFSDAKADAGGTIRQNTAPNVRRKAAAAPAPGAPAGRPSSGGFGMTLIVIVIGILAILFVFRILGALFRGVTGGGAGYGGGGPMMGNRGGYGPGGPGYGGGYGGAPAGGGGFMSSLFGGIGGAMAGNWLYDRMSGGHNAGYTDPNAGYDPNAGAAQVDNSPEWSGNDAGTDWGGGGTAVDNSGGGDWGGGGGGDWGGGGGDTGGGGDWGGGGGTDDNGGSW